MLADMRVAQGRLREALRMYEAALQRSTEQGSAAPRGTADVHVGISEIYVELNDLSAAEQHLMTSHDLGEQAGLPEVRYRWYTAMAALHQARGDLDGALESLQQAERLYAAGFWPDTRPIHALRTRVWLLQGRLDEAQRWVRQQELSVDDELSYLREYQHLTLARVLIAEAAQSRDDKQLRSAEMLLTRLLSAAEAGGRIGTVIETLVLLAVVRRELSEASTALEHLQRALELGEPEGYARVFLDDGASIAPLLERIAGGSKATYARRLLAEAHGAAPAESPPAQASLDALSERELAVLRLLAGDLSGPDIARELVVSLNTVRTHTKNIYTKLGANSRRAAVRRAQELGLL
jgi:LuxR family maltose regulon positive regulatory protein